LFLFEPLALESTKEFSAQDDFTASTHGLFQGGYLQHNLVNREEIIEEQLGLLSQLEIFHVFHDPVAAWMEKVSSGVPNIVAFGMPLNCNSKFELSIRFMLYLSCFFCVLSISCMQEVLIVSQMLSWLHWKFDVT
jgi:hypothetical protein